MSSPRLNSGFMPESIDYKVLFDIYKNSLPGFAVGLGLFQVLT